MSTFLASLNLQKLVEFQYASLATQIALEQCISSVVPNIHTRLYLATLSEQWLQKRDKSDNNDGAS